MIGIRRQVQTLVRARRSVVVCSSSVSSTSSSLLSQSSSLSLEGFATGRRGLASGSGSAGGDGADNANNGKEQLVKTKAGKYATPQQSEKAQLKKMRKAEKEQKQNAFVAQVESPKELGRKHIGQFYDLSPNNRKKLAPEGLGVDYDEEYSFLFEQEETAGGFLVREQFAKVADKMKLFEEKETDEGAEGEEKVKVEKEEEEEEEDVKLDEELENASVVTLSGERGTGKSMLLNLAILRARAAGWLVMYLPDSREWLSDPGAIEKGTGTAALLVESKIRKNFFGQPLGAQGVLKAIGEAHEEQLKSIKRKREYPHKGYDGDDSLMSIVNRGLKTAPFAADALYDLKMEFGLVTEVPVLVVVDQVNALYWPTCFYNQGEPVRPDELLVADTFRPLEIDGSVREDHKLKRGFTLCASTAKHGFPVTPKHILESYEEADLIPFKPYAVRGEGLDKKVSTEPKTGVYEIELTPLNSLEFRHMVIHMKKHNIIDGERSAEILDEAMMAHLLMINDGNARALKDHVFYAQAEPNLDKLN